MKSITLLYTINRKEKIIIPKKWEVYFNAIQKEIENKMYDMTEEEEKAYNKYDMFEVLKDIKNEQGEIEDIEIYTYEK